MKTKCKECGQNIAGRMSLDKALGHDEDKPDMKLNGDDDMKLGLLDELQDSMGSGIDGNIKIIIESRKLKGK
tara:strand:+ start:1045 stop:1260 length:216 start_codon:yes stop_codon:yes gene_type:complete